MYYPFNKKDMKSKNIKRVFIPGSEWLFIKIYAGITTCDDILIDIIYPLSLQLEKKGVILKWFFIRYSDPDFHIRYRVLIKSEDNFSTIVSCLNKKIKNYIEDSLIYKVCYDTYEREIERYGASMIENTESFFFEDSKLICKILKIVKNTNENYRWITAFILIDSFLSKLMMSLEEKHDFISHLDNSYKKEFGFNMYNSKQLNNMYRDKKNLIFKILDREVVDNVISQLYNLIEHAFDKMNFLSEQINKASYIHMMMNRLFITKNRAHELLIYNFICRYYKSKIAIYNAKN